MEPTGSPELDKFQPERPSRTGTGVRSSPALILQGKQMVKMIAAVSPAYTQNGFMLFFSFGDECFSKHTHYSFKADSRPDLQLP